MEGACLSGGRRKEEDKHGRVIKGTAGPVPSNSESRQHEIPHQQSHGHLVKDRLLMPHARNRRAQPLARTLSTSQLVTPGAIPICKKADLSMFTPLST
jgi:hypothetical protein